MVEKYSIDEGPVYDGCVCDPASHFRNLQWSFQLPVTVLTALTMAGIDSVWLECITVLAKQSKPLATVRNSVIFMGSRSWASARQPSTG